MFDLEREIRSWRASLERNAAFRPEDLGELESHLRDQIEDLTAAGGSREKAFLAATARIGSGEELAREYAKEGVHPFWSVRTAWLLIGVVVMIVLPGLAFLPAWAIASVSAWLEIPLSGLPMAVAALLVFAAVLGPSYLAGRALLRHGVPDRVRQSGTLIIGFPFLVIALVSVTIAVQILATMLGTPDFYHQMVALVSYSTSMLRLFIPVLLGGFLIRNWNRFRARQLTDDSRIGWLLAGAMTYMCLMSVYRLLSLAMLFLYSAAGVSPHFLSTAGGLVIVTSMIVTLAWFVERVRRRHTMPARFLWVQLLAIILASLIVLAEHASPSWLVQAVTRLDPGLLSQYVWVKNLGCLLLSLSALSLVPVCLLRLRRQFPVKKRGQEPSSARPY